MSTKTYQEIVDDVVPFLYSQGPSYITSPGRSAKICAYRGLNDTRCAIGYYIPDAKYLKGFEEIYVGAHEIFKTLPKSITGGVGSAERRGFLVALQITHDKPLHDIAGQPFDIEKWRSKFLTNVQELCETYNLKAPEPVMGEA